MMCAVHDSCFGGETVSKPVVFISYSRRDAEWKGRLADHLSVAEKQGQLNQWFDTRIGAGEDWEPQIETAMNTASVAILLVTANYLNSEYVLNKELPLLLQRRASDGLRVIPILVKPCDWEAVDWLKRMNIRPDPKRPISAGNEHQIDSDFTAIAKEIRELLKKTAPPTAQTFVLLSPDDISISRLPRLLTPDLFGRGDELKLLDNAWANPQTNVISFVAWGGVGKSAIVSHWLQALERDHWRGAERVFAWSFYSQGTSDRSATAEFFINAALRWFGGDQLADRLQTAGQWEKGERLAQLIRQTRTLLILDGLEPVQHPPLHADAPEGGLKEQSMQALLRELAAHQPGLCVISTRCAITDLTQFEGRTVIRHPLDELAPPAGAELLRRLKVNGTQEELEAVAREYGGHSLALTLLGSYLGDVYAGDVRRRHEIESLEGDRKHGRHARKMLRAYEKWLGEIGQQAMLDVLRMLGLFDRPADGAAMAALRAAPVIAGLTSTLPSLNERAWRQTLAALRDLRLLAEAAPHDPDTLDAHPLVREHFREQLQLHYPDAWRAANLRLYEHLTATTKDLPNTVEEMAPLFAAVTHGCAAGRHQQALDDVYERRIQRGEEYFSIRKLGAFGAELAALASFFATPWRQPVAGLPAAYQAFVLNAAGFHLRALGRLQEAAEPMQAALQAEISLEDWKEAAVVAGNLSELYLMLGDLPQALELARQSVALADRSGDEFERMSDMTTLADALHQAGQAEEAAAAFRQAEEMQKQRQPEYPLLNSLRGFRYCELLLGQGQHQEVKERAARTLEWVKQHGSLLSDALDNLSLGRAWLLQSGAGDDGRAAEFLQRAVDGLRQTELQYLPFGLLARAELRRVTGEYERARTDLDEVQRIAERGGMGLHLADCHLERARLYLATGERDKAREHWTTAKAMIERMGYHRRDKDVAEIEAQLG